MKIMNKGAEVEKTFSPWWDMIQLFHPGYCKYGFFLCNQLHLGVIASELNTFESSDPVVEYNLQLY
ncbi:hypothetical protein AU377_01245 [Sporosarcina sp. HYO08]|nr:hypothetical protein AU377_01245 [Sporosarcina sp. HYO08]